MQSNNRAFFFGAIVLAVLAIAACIYYAIPGFYHVLTFSDPMRRHTTHMIAFGILAVVCIIAALITRPRSA